MISSRRTIFVRTILLLFAIALTGCGARVKPWGTKLTLKTNSEVFGQMTGMTDTTVIIRAQRSEAIQIHWRTIDMISIEQDGSELLSTFAGAAIGAAPGAALLPVVKGIGAMYLPIAMMIVCAPLGAIVGYHSADRAKVIYITSARDLELLKPYVVDLKDK